MGSWRPSVKDVAKLRPSASLCPFVPFVSFVVGAGVARSGVAPIDEIDAHLHPAWQREIGFRLKQRFPKGQSIVTSHSPMICHAADQHESILPEARSLREVAPGPLRG